MRQLLFVLFLLASLPAARAQFDTPYAKYDPTSGDIVLHNLLGWGGVTLYSRSGSLRASLLDEVPQTTPAGFPTAVVNASATTPTKGIGWHAAGTPKLFRDISLNVPQAVSPSTPLSD